MAEVKFSQLPLAGALVGDEVIVGLKPSGSQSDEENVLINVEDLTQYILNQDSNAGGGGAGDVTGPASSTDNNVVLFDGATGKAIKDSGAALSTFYRASGTDVALADGGTGASLADPNADRIMFWDDSAGAVTWLEVGSGLSITTTTLSASGGALTNWTEAVNSSAPNATVPVTSFTATNAATNVDAAVVPKGTGALLAAVPDGTATGGNKRGTNAVDLQTSARGAATQVASGTSSVVGGGSRNTASAQHTVVSGGYQNNAAGQYAAALSGRENSASGNFDVVCGGGGVGSGNTASGGTAAVVGGSGNTASGGYSFIGGGSSNIASGTQATVPGGANCRADATYAMAWGSQATTRTISGATANASGFFASQGDAQQRFFVLRSDTTNATPEAVTTDNSSAGTGNQIILPNSSLFAFRGHLVVRENATGDSKAIEFKGAIKRGANAASTALLGSVTQADIGTPDAGATWTVAFTADTTNGGLKIEVTGEASHTLRWVARVETVEVVG